MNGKVLPEGLVTSLIRQQLYTPFLEEDEDEMDQPLTSESDNPKIPEGLVTSLIRQQLYTPFLEEDENEKDQPLTSESEPEKRKVPAEDNLPPQPSPSSSSSPSPIRIQPTPSHVDAREDEEIGRKVQEKKPRIIMVMPTPRDREREPFKFAVARRVTWTRQVVKYLVLSAESPFEFYAIEEPDKDDYFDLSGGAEKLQLHANRMKLDLESWRPQTLVKDMMYTTYDTSTGAWHRCRLLKLDEETGKAVVFYIDSPHFKMVEMEGSDLRKIPNRIASYAIVPMYKCHLYDILPTDGSYDWDDDIKARFVDNLKRQNVWLGLQMSWTEKPIGGLVGVDVQMNVGMILFENTPNVWEGISLNWRLVKNGEARAIGLGGTYFSNLFFSDSEPMFSLQGAPAVTLPQWIEKPFPYAAGSRLPQVKIITALALDCMYVTLINKHLDLRAMEHFMISVMDLKLSRKLVKFGTPVLCMERVQRENGVTNIKPRRGVVLKIFQNVETTVLQVDTGKVIKIPIDDLYVMHPRLAKIPAFVHRIHLKNIRPKGTLKWSSDLDARANLLKFLDRLENNNLNPAYFAFRDNPTSNADVVALTEIHQPLVYSCPESKWTAALPEKQDHFSLQSMTLLNSYFYSFGVDLKIYLSENDNNTSNGSDKQEIWKLFSLSSLIAHSSEKFNAEAV